MLAHPAVVDREKRQRRVSLYIGTPITTLLNKKWPVSMLTSRQRLTYVDVSFS
jgi:hypothetical protein